MNSVIRALYFWTGSGAACMVSAIPALADETPQLQEIVVTAEKRTENLQEVPIAVTVVSGDAFTKANVSSFASLAAFSPSLTMTAGDQPANSSIIVRGVGTFAFSIAAEPSVLVVIDDVAVGYQAQAFTDLVDIDQVEVLNGPQSTAIFHAIHKHSARRLQSALDADAIERWSSPGRPIYRGHVQPGISAHIERRAQFQLPARRLLFGRGSGPQFRPWLRRQ